MGFGEVVILVLFTGLLLASLYVIISTIRLAILLRRPGALQCSARVAKHWKTGVLLLQPFRLEWYSTKGLSPRPQQVFERDFFDIASHKQVSGKENLIVVEFSYRGSTSTWAMSDQSFAGLVSWIDAAPPKEEPILI